MKPISVYVDQIKLFLTIKKDEIKINVDVNVNN